MVGLNGNVSFRYSWFIAHKFDGERFKLGKLNEPEVKEKYQIEITNRFAVLENLKFKRT